MTGRVETKDYLATFDDSETAKQEVFHRVLKYFSSHEAFSGESVMQCDGPQIEAAPLLAELADEVFKFNLTFKE